MLQLQKGRPQSTEGREAKEIKTYDFLDALAIEYERVDHEPVMTMEACEEIDELLGNVLCKNLLLTDRKRSVYFLLMIRADKRLDTKVLSHRLGTSRLSFAKGEEMEELLHLTPGSLTAMGLIFDTEHRVDVLIDESLCDETYLSCHPCVNTSSIRLLMKDFRERFLPAVHHELKVVSLEPDEEGENGESK